MGNYRQVDAFHYRYELYMDKARWASGWHQLDEVIRIGPKNVLEIGPGPGVFKQACRAFGVNVETLDIDSALNPDFVGSAMALPFADASYDVVCAFQVLEHLPYEIALQAFSEMTRVSRRNVVLSLPDAKRVWQYRFHIPTLGSYTLLVPRPAFKLEKHEFNGEHYWEVNKQGYDLARIIQDFSKFSVLVRTYRVFENPYHRLFVFERPIVRKSVLCEK